MKRFGYEIGPNADLKGAHLTGADLSGANLSGADLTGADLSGANLFAANLRGANLTGANLRRAYFNFANFSGADLTGVDLTGAYLFGVNLTGANLEVWQLKEANFEGVILKGADLRKAPLMEALLKEADLSAADLRGAGLRGAILTGANLRGADLRGADLRRAWLKGADLSGADLRGAFFYKGDLFGANLEGAILKGTILEEAKPQKVETETVKKVEPRPINTGTSKSYNSPKSSYFSKSTWSRLLDRFFENEIAWNIALLCVLALIPLIIWLTTLGPETVDIKYRGDDVNVSDFEKLTCGDCRGVDKAWYDPNNDYLIIKLESGRNEYGDRTHTNYHYCRVPSVTWNRLKSEANSSGGIGAYQYYQNQIQGNFDCRDDDGRYVPDY